MAIIYLPSALARRANVSSLEVNANRLVSCLEQLVQSFPDIKAYIFSADSLVAPFTKIFINQIDSNSLAGLNTNIADKDEIQIVVAVAGG